MKIARELKAKIEEIKSQIDLSEEKITALEEYKEDLKRKIFELEEEMSDLDGVFGRIVMIEDSEIEGVALFHEEGETVTRLRGLEGESICPVDSDFSVAREHPEGIVISTEDANRLEIEIE